MEKKTVQTGFRVALVTGDAALVLASIPLSYWLRFSAGLIPVMHDVPLLKYYLFASPYVMLVYLLAFNYSGLYRFARNISRLDEFYRVFLTASAAIVILMSTTFMVRFFSYSRVVLVLMWATGVLLLGSWRYSYRSLFRYMSRKELLVRKLAIAGDTEVSRMLIERIRREPNLGYEIVGIVDDRTAPGSLVNNSPVLGPISSLASVIREKGVDEVFVGLSDYDRRGVADTIMENEKVRFMIASDVLNIITKNIEFDELYGIPVFTVKELPLDSSFNRTIKRTFDIIASGLALVVLSPLFFVVAVIIKLTSPGPVFYKQERVSRDNMKFMLNKFRSMRQDAEQQSGPVWAKENDPRRTSFGTFLRKTSIDELPQFINVFLGNMSIVGPRPERPHFVDRFSRTIPRYMERHRAKAGMTGWAAINGLRGDTSIEERVKYDLYYIENWSLWFDVKICVRTVLEVFHHRTAY